MALLVPSRGRPQNIERLKRDLVESYYAGPGDRYLDLIVGLDEDDPSEYSPRYQNTYELKLEVNPRLRLGGTLNLLANKYKDYYDILGFLGDDHSPRGTWQRRIEEELTAMRVGMVYGDDGHQGVNLPTAIFMTSNIVKTLGWMVPPGMQHMYLDNIWKDLGEAAGCIKYLPDVKIEHLHPAAGKSEWDERYEEVNSAAQYSVDLARYTEWKEKQMAADVAKIKAIM